MEDYLYRTAYHFKAKAYRIVNKGNLQLRLLGARKARNHVVPFSTTEPMEKLVIYNGSPRRSGGNSTRILKNVAAALGDRVDIRDLKESEKWEAWAEAFERDKHVMFFMPLYVHAMPSHVMGFIEKLQASGGSISFFVQSGFPESSQSHYLEAYFEQLAIRMGRTYLGTVIKGGVESLKMRPPSAQDKMIEPMVKVIVHLMREGNLDEADVRQLASPLRFGKGTEILFHLIGKRFLNFFWDQQLKANKAYEKRFDCPY